MSESSRRLYDLLRGLAERPEPFSIGGPHELWTDPYVQRQLLASHLDPDVEAASRPHRVIDRSVAWIAERFAVGPGRRVLDLGCGPGLYANPLAARGATVHGIDLSATSVAEARRRATSPGATFAVGDYLRDALPAHDLALLIYGDYCALSPDDRHRLLHRVAARIAPDGRLLLDVFSAARYASVREGCVIEDRLMDGFWAPGDYVGVHQTRCYDEVRVTLDRYVIVEPDRVRTVHAWLAHLTLEQARGELAQAGFDIVELHGDLAGAPYDPCAPELALVAAPHRP